MSTVSSKHASHSLFSGLFVLILCGGLVLTGCSRFEFNLTKHKADQALKQPISSKTECTADNNSSFNLVDRLDNTLLKTKESKTWPVSPTNHCKKVLPYHFTVISMSPIVAIGTPAKLSVNNRCIENSAAINCLRSKKFDGYYEIENTFSHSAGLVWFSPEHGPRLFDVPAHAKSMFMMIDGKSIRLKRKENWWLFTKKH